MGSHVSNPILAALALAGIVVLAARARRPVGTSASPTSPDNLSAKVWFWSLIAVGVVLVGFGCLVAAASVDVPACRVPGRLDAEGEAGSWVGGALVASAVAFVVALLGRSRTRKSQRRFVATLAALASALALCLAAVGYWLVLIFPCAAD